MLLRLAEKRLARPDAGAFPGATGNNRNENSKPDVRLSDPETGTAHR